MADGIGIEFIDIASMERRSLEAALAQLVAKYSRFPSSELARMIRGINAEIIQRRIAREAAIIAVTNS